MTDDQLKKRRCPVGRSGTWYPGYGRRSDPADISESGPSERRRSRQAKGSEFELVSSVRWEEEFSRPRMPQPFTLKTQVWNANLGRQVLKGTAAHLEERDLE